VSAGGPELTLNAGGGLPASRWLQLEGPGPTHYVDFGGPTGGPVVVCVHGLGGSVVNWLALAPLLATRARVLAFDLAGHGRTRGHGRGANLAAHRAHLARFLDAAAGEPVVLIGNSMGGVVSLLQASEEPGSVRRLVLVNPALPVAARSGRLPEPLVAAVFTTYLAPYLAEFLIAARRRRTSAERLVRQSMALCMAHPDRAPAELVAAAIALAHEHASRDDVDAAYLASARSLLRMVLVRPGLLHSVIARVAVPTLLLHGAHDRLVPVGAARAIAATRPDWRLEIHDDAGHLPQVEDPGWVARHIFAWLEDLSPLMAPG
jgi:pimeloyl-ACP methyl ester carboxylesterase